MKVYIAKKAGFCMGVRRAVDLTLDLVNNGEQNIATYGPLIHNPQVLDVLADKGVGILDKAPEQAADLGTVIIRAHGIPAAEKKNLLDMGLMVKDATCPRVLKVQAIIRKYRKQGMTTVIVGDRNHAEVEGLMGYAGPDCKVVSNEGDAHRLELAGDYIIVSQTTQEEGSFTEICRIITARFPGGKIFNTICDSTHKRQDEVRKLCQNVEALVVVGGRSSANTKRLAEIAQGLGKTVFLIETEAELDKDALSQFNRVGVTAGASTPTWMINRVVRVLEAVPGRGEGIICSSFFQCIRLVMLSNFYVALAGGLLVSACSLLQGIAPGWKGGLVAFGYLFAMHNLNRFTDQRAKIFNDPLLLVFYKKYRWIMLGLSNIFLLISLGLVFVENGRAFILLVIMSVLGILYSIKFIPNFISSRLKVRRLKEIPASKTFFVALAWASVLVVLPALINGSAGVRTLAVFAFIFLLVVVRNSIFDIFDMQGDRIVGKETLPVLIGLPKTMLLLKFIVAFLFLLSVFMTTFGLMVAPLGYLLIPSLLYLAALLVFYEKGYYTPGVRLEFGLESSFVIMAGSIWLGYAWLI